LSNPSAELTRISGELFVFEESDGFGNNPFRNSLLPGEFDEFFVDYSPESEELSIYTLQITYAGNPETQEVSLQGNGGTDSIFEIFSPKAVSSFF